MPLLDRLVAWAYDPLMAGAERGALGRLRRGLLADVAGEVVVVGAGTGADLPHLPADVERVTLVEPSAAMRERLARRAARSAHTTAVVDGTAEALPLPDDAVDHAVVALVLCSVRDPAAAVAELDRVVRPGGSVVVVEHGRSTSGPRARRLQRAAEPVWRRLAGGCHLTRDPRAALSTRFDVSGLQPVRVPPVSRIGTVVAGRATR